MQNTRISTGGFKFVLGWLVVFFIRLIPFRPPNVEPMLATLMPFSKRYGVWGSMGFAFFGILIFDAVTSGIGMWTWITAVAYALLGAGAYWFFKNRKASVKNFVVFGVIGTVLYDAVTGLSVGPLFFGQPFMEALIGQIPFTLMHLGGTVAFSIVLSPVLYKWVVVNEELEIPALARRLGFSR